MARGFSFLPLLIFATGLLPLDDEVDDAPFFLSLFRLGTLPPLPRSLSLSLLTSALPPEMRKQPREPPWLDLTVVKAAPSPPVPSSWCLRVRVVKDGCELATRAATGALGISRVFAVLSVLAGLW